MFDLRVLYILGKDNTVADCLSNFAHAASMSMTDLSVHGGEVNTPEATNIIDPERIMEAEGLKCFILLAGNASQVTESAKQLVYSSRGC